MYRFISLHLIVLLVVIVVTLQAEFVALHRGAPSKFQGGGVGSKKNSILHSGADPESFGGGNEILI